jgi:hypothetical protein
MSICANCEKPMNHSEAVVEHLVPLSRGGKNTEDNIIYVHRQCHRREPSALQLVWRIIHRTFGLLLCLIGRHKWLPIVGTEDIDWQSKWVVYETARGRCAREGCDAEADIRRDYYW